jgi:sugar lactone lactonase YvrE
MADRTFASLADGGGFFEGPRWRDGRWWVSDFYRHAVFTIDPDGTTEQVMTVEAQPSGLGWMPDGSLLVVSMKDHRVLRRAPDGTVTVHAEIGEHCGGLANDIIVAADGRAWVATSGSTSWPVRRRGRPRWCGSTLTARRRWPLPASRSPTAPS